MQLPEYEGNHAKDADDDEGDDVAGIPPPGRVTAEAECGGECARTGDGEEYA
jgi:hypothetical protein